MINFFEYNKDEQSAIMTNVSHFVDDMRNIVESFQCKLLWKMLYFSVDNLSAWHQRKTRTNVDGWEGPL